MVNWEHLFVGDYAIPLTRSCENCLFVRVYLTTCGLFIVAKLQANKARIKAAIRCKGVSSERATSSSFLSIYFGEPADIKE